MSHNLDPSKIVRLDTDENHKFIAYRADNPNGVTFDDRRDDKKDLASQGWVENPAYLGINIWGPQAEDAVQQKKKAFENKEFPAFEPTFKQAQVNAHENEQLIQKAIAQQARIDELEARVAERVSHGKQKEQDIASDVEKIKESTTPVYPVETVAEKPAASKKRPRRNPPADEPLPRGSTTL